MFAKLGTGVSFNMSVSVFDPLADPMISDNATFTSWVNVTVVNPSDRRLTLHYLAYSGWIHDLEVENGSALDRRPQDNFLPRPDGSILLYFRSFAGAVAFPTPTAFIEAHAQRTFAFSFSLERNLVFRFDSTRSIVQFAQARNLTWSDIDWFHHVVLQIQILGVPTNYEETTSLFYLHTFPIIEREAGFELPG